MTKAPRVSVIINCLNSEKYLREAIDSVYAQKYDDWEIVLFDNASTDETAAIAKSYDDRLRYARGNVTVPLGEARNQALAQARGVLVAFLDSDDLWLPERLARGVAALDAKPDSDLVYSNFLHLTAAGRRSVAIRTVQPSGDVFEPLLARYTIGILTVLVRKRALDRLEALFDPALHLAEDYDLFMRVLLQSRAIYLHEPLAVYRIHPDMLTARLNTKATEEFYCCLAKLRRLDADGRHAGAFARATRLAEYELAKQYLAAGAFAVARKHVAPLKWSGYKPLLVYLASFLPSGLWFALRPFWARGTFR